MAASVKSVALRHKIYEFLLRRESPAELSDIMMHFNASPDFDPAEPQRYETHYDIVDAMNWLLQERIVARKMPKNGYFVVFFLS